MSHLPGARDIRTNKKPPDIFLTTQMTTKEAPTGPCQPLRGGPGRCPPAPPKASQVQLAQDPPMAILTPL
jgi:hypothetical protein